MSQSSEDPPLISRTTLIVHVPLLLMQQVRMKEKYERIINENKLNESK